MLLLLLLLMLMLLLLLLQLPSHLFLYLVPFTVSESISYRRERIDDIFLSLSLSFPSIFLDSMKNTFYYLTKSDFSSTNNGSIGSIG